MADVRIESDVRDVLSRANALGNTLRLPPEQLDRKLYERVNEVLTNAGGKWNKSARAHIFPTDAAPKLAAMLGVGVSIDEKKRDQAFFTPPELARRVVEIADVAGCTVLEPSAGLGALADACQEAGAESVTCLEVNPEFIRELEKRYAWDAQCVDFLSVLPDENESVIKNGVKYATSYDRIVMNPPFTKNQDIKHVKHALKWLQPGGVLVSLMMPNQNRKGFQEIVDEYDPEIIEVERGAFKGSGTDIATLIVKIQRTSEQKGFA